MAPVKGVLPLHMVENPPYTIPSPGYKPVEGETIPRRHPKAKDGLVQKLPGNISTIYELLTSSGKKYANKPSVGSRKLLKTHTEVKKVPKVVNGEVQEVDKEWQFFELSDFSYLTYREYEKQVLEVGAGLRKLGLSQDDRVHLFATTRSVPIERRFVLVACANS